MFYETGTVQCPPDMVGSSLSVMLSEPLLNIYFYLPKNVSRSKVSEYVFNLTA